MKRYWGWILACVAVLYLLWSLGLQASINPATSFDQHLVAAPRPSRSLSSYRGQGFLSRRWTRTRAGPLESFFPPDVLLRVEDLDSVGPPWLESRGPPGRYLGVTRSCRPAGRDGCDGGPNTRVNYAPTPEFSRQLLA